MDDQQYNHMQDLQLRSLVAWSEVRGIRALLDAEKQRHRDVVRPLRREMRRAKKALLAAAENVNEEMGIFPGRYELLVSA